MSKPNSSMAFFEKNSESGAGKSVFLNKYFPAVSLGAFAALLAFGYFFILSDKVQAVRSQKNTQLPAVKKELAALGDYFQKNSELENYIGSYLDEHGEDIKKIDSVLPLKPNQPELIAQLQALAAKNGYNISHLDMATIKPKAKQSRGEAQETESEPTLVHALDIQLNLMGSDYPSFKKFLAGVEEHLRILDVYSINFSSTSEGTSMYTIGLKSYYMDIKE